MTPWFRSKPQSLIGLDINSDEIRLLQLKRTKKEVSIENWAIARLPPDTIVEGKIKNTLALKNTLQQIINSTQTKGQIAAFALPAKSVISKRIKLPYRMTEKECEREITNNLNDHFPGMANELCFDYVRVGDDVILLAAVRKDCLYDYINLIEQAGLTVKIVDIDSFALARVIELMCLPNQSVALLEYNRSSAKLSVFQNEEIIFNQSISIGELKNELRRALQLCHSTFRQIKLDLFLLSGQAADIEKIPDFLREEYALQSNLANPFLNIKVAPGLNSHELQQAASRMLVSCGLALRGMPKW